MAIETLFGPMAVISLLIIYLIIIIVYILLFIFWIVMVIDVTKRKFKVENDRITWILVVVLAGVIGAIIYYFVVKRKDSR